MAFMMVSVIPPSIGFASASVLIRVRIAVPGILTRRRWRDESIEDHKADHKKVLHRFILAIRDDR